MCANCGTTVGPFYKAWIEKGEVVVFTPPLCKNTRQNSERISQCVARRDKIDYEKYKEAMHAYDA